MAPSGRKHGGKAGKQAQEDQAIPTYDFQEERKELSGSEEDIGEGAYVIFLKWGLLKVDAVFMLAGQGSASSFVALQNNLQLSVNSRFTVLGAVCVMGGNGDPWNMFREVALQKSNYTFNNSDDSHMTQMTPMYFYKSFWNLY